MSFKMMMCKYENIPELQFIFQDYQVDLYLRQHWYDSRLQHPKLIDLQNSRTTYKRHLIVNKWANQIT